MVSGLLNDARNATCFPRMLSAPSTNRLGNPSGNFFQEISRVWMSRCEGCAAIAFARSFICGQ